MIERSLMKLAALGLMAAAIAFTPALTPAQTTNKPVVEKKGAAGKKDSASKKGSPHPMHGIVTAIDKTAKTITVGKVTYQITSETKIKKADKPGTLDDGVVGEEARGYVKPADDGKLNLSSLSFGPKTEKAAPRKK